MCTEGRAPPKTLRDSVHLYPHSSHCRVLSSFRARVWEFRPRESLPTPSPARGHADGLRLCPVCVPCSFPALTIRWHQDSTGHQDCLPGVWEGSLHPEPPLSGRAATVSEGHLALLLQGQEGVLPCLCCLWLCLLEGWSWPGPLSVWYTSHCWTHLSIAPSVCEGGRLLCLCLAGHYYGS